MATSIIGLLVALVPVAVTLLQLYLKRKNDPEQIRESKQSAIDAEVVYHNGDDVNRRIADSLARLQDAKRNRDTR